VETLAGRLTKDLDVVETLAGRLTKDLDVVETLAGRGEGMNWVVEVDLSVVVVVSVVVIAMIS